MKTSSATTAGITLALISLVLNASLAISQARFYYYSPYNIVYGSEEWERMQKENDRKYESGYDYTFMLGGYHEEYPDSMNIQLKSLEFTDFNIKKGKDRGVLRYYSKNFLPSGKVKSWKSKKHQAEFDYDANENKVASRKATRDGAPLLSLKTDYNSAGYRTALELTDERKGKLKRSRTKKYESDSVLTEVVNFKGNDKIMSSRTTWAYHETGAVAKIKYFNKKNKLYRSRVFDCNEKIEKEVKNTIQICRNTTVDEDGNRVESTRSIGKDGKAVTTYTTYIDDKHWIKIERKDDDNTILSRSERAYNDRMLVTRMSYRYGKKLNKGSVTEMAYTNDSFKRTTSYKQTKANGKIRFFWTAKYDTMGNMVERRSYDKNGDLKGRWEYVRNEQGKAVEARYYEKDTDELTGRSKFEYDEKGLQKLAESYDEKGRLSSRTTIIRSFYN